MNPAPDGLAEAVTEFTGSTPGSPRRLGGGDASAAFEVPLERDRSVFAKSAPRDMPGALDAEAASLTWLRAGGARTPAVHGNNARWMVTEHIPTSAATPEAAEEFGRELATMHAAGAEAHGCPPPNGPTDAWIGLAPMRNEPSADWPTFYAAHRVEPYVRDLVDSGTLRDSEAREIRRVCDRLDELPGADEPPARLHGDLWSGNVQWGRISDGSCRVWLIDPAAHGGHRETDLAMLHLFGCPHLEVIVRAYEQAWPPADGWRERIGLHQLFPLLVHGVLFGRGFAAQAVSAARDANRTF